jgi:DNA primase
VPWNGIGARGVLNLASRMLLALLPPTQQFFRFSLDEAALAQQGVGLEQKSEFELALSKIEREVLKAKVQMPELASGWPAIEGEAFTHPAYKELRAVIDVVAVDRPLTIELVTNENMKALFTELSVEPIRTDGEISQIYVSSIIARLREVSVSRAIADLKSSLQRLNPVENEAEYNAAFATLVSLESTRRGLHDLAVGGL